MSLSEKEQPVCVEGVSDASRTPRRYPAPTLDEVRQRIRELGVSEEHLHRYFSADPETFANNT